MFEGIFLVSHSRWEGNEWWGERSTCSFSILGGVFDFWS